MRGHLADNVEVYTPTGQTPTRRNLPALPEPATRAGDEAMPDEVPVPPPYHSVPALTSHIQELPLPSVPAPAQTNKRVSMDADKENILPAAQQSSNVAAAGKSKLIPSKRSLPQPTSTSSMLAARKTSRKLSTVLAPASTNLPRARQ